MFVAFLWEGIKIKCVEIVLLNLLNSEVYSKTSCGCRTCVLENTILVKLLKLVTISYNYCIMVDAKMTFGF